jgi:pimeloyl-ACP methyl ester carboxylesterase/alkanesulfonate monooxygenase SsuD/methylene tetrahydromethanopterin reductase-like flavin-dependent oxidoreductase (luciferase family)
VNEHHANAYGNMPSPNLIASILARQTARMRIAVVGNALPLYNPPVRVAEEYAMIDCISGGRLIAGMVVGGGPEYYSNGLNPAEARGRFSEALDLILRCWTEPGPFVHMGKYLSGCAMNPRPTPIRSRTRPSDPGAGSYETMDFIAQRRWAYMGIPYFHKRVFQRNFDYFREACAREGYTAAPEQMGWLVPVYVAETDARARAEFEPHLWYFARKLLPGINIAPPGYTSARSALKMLGAFGDFLLNVTSWYEVIDGAYAIVGSPATVRARMAALARELGVGNVLTLLQLGTLPADLTRRNMDLFAAEVMPALRRELDGRRGAPRSRRRRHDARTAHGRGRRRADAVLVGAAGRPPLPPRPGGDVEWLEAHDRLAARFTVHVPAHPGFAESTGIEHVDGIFDYVLHYVDLLAALGFERLPVVGTSLGGWVAAELAALYPDRVARLVLVDAVDRIDAAPIGEMFGAPPPELARMIFHDQQHPIAQMMHAMTTLANVPEDFAYAQMKALEAAAKIGWNPYLHDPKLERRLRRVTAPTLVLWGRQDGLVSVLYAERWQARIPGAVLEVIDRCGHLPPIERPAEFASAVLRFLAREG